MTKLIITEKPGVAKDIANVLGKFKSKDGYMENGEYHITWAVGHLLELATPDEYVGKGRWTFINLPIIPDEFKLKISPKTAGQFNVINKIIKQNSYKYVICATDAGREGELIFRYIYQMTGCTLPIKRLWISSMAAPDIKKGFDELLDGESKENLAQAAYCRAEADWLVGMNGTRAMSIKHGDTLSVGRVQTPTLAIIVNREKEIRNFIPVPYWEVDAIFENTGKYYKGRYIKDNSPKIAAEAEAQEISKAAAGQVGVIDSVKKKKSEESPPKLYNLTDLQRECNKKYGMSAALTLETVQKLYEEFKFITYPRTDSNHLSTAQIPTFPKILRHLQTLPELAKFTEPLLALPKLPVNKKFVDDSKLTDHHAIIPTEQKPDLRRLNATQSRVYLLIAKRFVAVFYGPCKAENTTILTKVGEYIFKTTGKVVIEAGWTEIYGAEPKVKDDDRDKEKEEEETQTLPPVKKGDKYNVSECIVLSKETKKPSQFTEASLLGAMETAGKLIEDEELRAKMKGMSLGTPATRASIIETLISRQYIERKGKKLIPTDKGIRLIELIPVPELKQPELTAQWEKRLADIEKGLDTRPEFMNDIKQFTSLIVSSVKSRQSQQAQKKTKRIVVGNCPKCGEKVIRGNQAWGCLNIRTGQCDFKIGFKKGSQVLTDDHARELLSHLPLSKN